MSSQEGMDSLCVCEPTLCMGANPYKVPRTTKQVEKKKKKDKFRGEKVSTDWDQKEVPQPNRKMKKPQGAKEEPIPSTPTKESGIANLLHLRIIGQSSRNHAISWEQVIY